MRGYADAQARQIFRDLIDMPADVTVTARRSTSASTAARTCRSSSTPGFSARSQVPWWNGATLRFSE